MPFDFRQTLAFAGQPILTVWYAHLEIEQAIADYKSTLSARQLKELKVRIKATEGAIAKARTRDSLQAIGKLSTVVDGKRQIISNPPFGKQLSTIENVGPLYEAAAREMNRVLRPGGRAVLLAMEQELLKRVLKAHRWSQVRQTRIRLLGQPCVMSVWNKPF